MHFIYRFLFGVLCVLCSSTLISQNITVKSSTNHEAISGVAVYNIDKSKNGISDLEGRVDITVFETNETIFFQHLGHKTLEILKSKIQGDVLFLEEEESTLDEVVLSVAKFGQKKKDVPQQIVSVSSEDVLFSNPQTSADLLESTGQVYIQKSQLGGGSPLIRGFSTNRLLITVDGVRFNTAIYRSGNVQNIISIDPFALANTEVILGPGSIVYGSDAVGGVINFYSKKPKFSFEEGISLSGSTTARYATANQEKTGHLDFNIGLKEWAFLSSLTFSDFDDLKMGSHGPESYLRHEYVITQDGEDIVVQNEDPKKQVPTGYSQINAMQKVRYMPNEHWDFDLGFFYTTTSDYARYDRLYRRKNGALRSAEWYYGPQEWLSGNLQVTHKAETFFDEAKSTLSYQRFKESRNDRDFGDPILFETDETVHAYTGGLDFTKKIGKNNLYYGVEYIYNKVNSEGKKTNVNSGVSEPDASRYPDGSTWQSIAAYTSLQWYFTNDLSFQGGLRYNHILVNATFDDTFYDFPFSEADINTGALTGSAGLAWQASSILGWKLNFSTAFRAPNIDDVGKVFDSEPGSVVVPNPDLKPEYAYNGELAATLNFEDIVVIDMATYVTHLEDALVRRDYHLNGETEIYYQGELSNVQAIQNASKAQLYGFEVGTQIHITKEIEATAQYSITDGFQEEEDGSHVPVRHVAPQFGNAHLKYSPKKWKFDAFVEYNGEMDYQDLAPSQKNNAYIYAKDENGNPYSPSWYTLNFATQYQISEALQVNAVIENITDQRYRPYSSGIAAAGRNLILAATYVF